MNQQQPREYMSNQQLCYLLNQMIEIALSGFSDIKKSYSVNYPIQPKNINNLTVNEQLKLWKLELSKSITLLNQVSSHIHLMLQDMSKIMSKTTKIFLPQNKTMTPDITICDYAYSTDYSVDSDSIDRKSESIKASCENSGKRKSKNKSLKIPENKCDKQLIGKPSSNAVKRKTPAKPCNKCDNKVDNISSEKFVNAMSYNTNDRSNTSLCKNHCCTQCCKFTPQIEKMFKTDKISSVSVRSKYVKTNRSKEKLRSQEISKSDKRSSVSVHGSNRSGNMDDKSKMQSEKLFKKDKTGSVSVTGRSHSEYMNNETFVNQCKKDKYCTSNRSEEKLSRIPERSSTMKKTDRIPGKVNDNQVSFREVNDNQDLENISAKSHQNCNINEKSSYNPRSKPAPAASTAPREKICGVADKYFHVCNCCHKPR